MQAKVTFNAGIGYTKSGHLVPELPVSVMTVRAVMAQAFGGYTETPTLGGWINGKGELVQEQGLQWEALTIADSLDALQEKAERIAGLIAVALDQEAVIYQLESARFEFVSQPATINAPKAEVIHHE